MVVLKCKMCSGNIIPLEDGTTGICDSCGTTVVLPSITDERRADAFNRGNQFRKEYEFDKALKEYGQIVKEDPTDAEAHWCMALCRYGINYQQDYVADKYIPTCDRLSDTSFLEDPDYRAALKHAKGGAGAIYRKEAEHIEKIRQELVRVSAQTEPYDVFICFKDTFDGDPNKRTPDSYAAQEIYMFLTEKGYRVFFSRITLKEEHLGQEWEPYIYAALNTARVMLVVGTSKEHFNSPWVKNEWSRFRAVRRKDPTKVLLACYQDMDGRDVPAELQVLETHNIKDSDGGFYSNLNYIVSRECRKQKKTVSAGAHATADNFVIRAEQALEDKNFDKADQLLEQALNLDPENGRAHLGKLLVARKCTKISELAKEERLLSKSGHYQRVVKYADANIQQQLRAAEASIRQRLAEKEKKEELNKLYNLMNKTTASELMEKIIQELEEWGDFDSAPEYLKTAKKRLEEIQKKEADEAEKQRQEEADRKKKAEAEAAQKAAAEETARKEAAAAAKRRKKKRRNRAIRRLVFLAILICVVGYFGNEKLVKPAKSAYANAEAYMAQGDYQNAAMDYFEVSESVVGKMLMKDAEEKGYAALERWLGWEPVVVSSDDYPWLSVDDDGGLQFDAGEYPGEENFTLPTVLDGKLITGFGSGCFSGLSGVKSLTVPANYTWIGSFCFSECENLNAITLSSSTIFIGSHAFEGCVSLTSINIPESVRAIHENAFENCSYLNSVTLNTGLEEIADGAFRGCGSLTAVSIPGTVQTIGYEAFRGTSLTSLTLESGLTTIGEGAFAEQDYLTSVTIPGTVAEIGNRAFYSCDALGSVVLESGVVSVGEEAFAECDQLWSLEFSDTLESLNYRAFYSCDLLGSIALPASLDVIGESAFAYCVSIGEVWIADNDGLLIGESAFYGCDNLTGVSVGAGTLSLGDSAFDNCDKLYWASLPEGLTSIGAWCFAYTALESVTIPSTVTALGEGAFFQNENLTGVTIPGGISIIEEDTFAHCGNLYWVWFSDGLSILRDDAFYGCDYLTQVYFSGSWDSWNAVSKGNNSWLGELQTYTDYYG